MRPNPRYLDINPEGKLLREAQDIAEELRIMIDIYTQQLNVVKDFHKCLGQLNGHPKVGARDRDTKRYYVQPWGSMATHNLHRVTKSDQELEYLRDLMEEVENRKTEIEDLENVALKTCQQVRFRNLLSWIDAHQRLQLQELLSLKQQQASIVEAKAALERADESVQQGKAIMAFTIMTIIFVRGPLTQDTS